MSNAAQPIRAAADTITHLATNPQAAQAVAQAASDTFAAVAVAVEGRRGGPITRAVDLFDKATREPNGRVCAPNTRSANLRAMSRLVHPMGQVAADTDIVAVLALLLSLARLADTVTLLREAQQRRHQAEAARAVAAILRGAVTSGGGSDRWRRRWPDGGIDPAHHRPAPDATTVHTGPISARQRPVIRGLGFKPDTER